MKFVKNGVWKEVAW